MAKRSGIIKAPKLVLAAVLVGGSLTGCGSEEEVVAYCVDKDDNIVDEENCDDDHDGAGSLWFFMVGNYNSGLQPGTKLDRSQGSIVNPTDASAREKAGLPKSGKVTTGKAGTYFKPGGFGSFKGGSGS